MSLFLSSHLLSRREWLASGTALLASACTHRKASGYPGYALVATSGENSVAAVDLNRFQLVKKIDLNSAPSAVIATQRQSYALTPANGTVHLLDGEQLRKVGSIRLGDHVDTVRLTPDGGRLVGISAKSRQLIVADVGTGKLLYRLSLGYEPLDFDLQVHSESQAVYAAISGGASGTVEFIDVTTKNRRRAQLNGTLGDIRFRLDGALALVGNYDDRTLVAVDTATAGVICEIALAMRPENFCFNSDQGQLFISGSGMDGVAIVFPYRTLEVDQTLLAGHAPGAMACSEKPAYLFVASRAGSEISIVNIDSRKVIAVTQAGQMPGHISITPDQQYALVLNEASGDMAVIRITTITANRRKSGASLFSMIPVGAKPVDTAIVTSLS
jgi:DNA-binding beta-propeller fold protein YncE